jgi:hypothetical protein
LKAGYSRIAGICYDKYTATLKMLNETRDEDREGLEGGPPAEA